LVFGLLCIALSLLISPAWSEDFIPRRQLKPPGPALSPAEAIAQMKVPEGFSVELVAAEPDIANPVAMTFDERGRIWVTESFEYPRHEPGPGRDRVKILEDTDGDGRTDKVTVFAEGLNIPSGIAVGAGGVWIANAPDILFMQDTDGDGRADKTEVVVTGFGRADTHELPNSLTWGPDGWLYGLNGVFNQSHVQYRGRNYDFTCALFRIHPRTRDFELFCEGTSNPWGVAWDREGSAFISACVIDHLWHLTETGYYHRQGGPYPPFVWKLGSIVKHKHQMAAYCGIHYFDSDAYPEQYREKLYMGNIHGNCLNCDVLERSGSSYFARPDPDFLTANDVWFMPVAQKTGPDGCLYVLDWYDRYHCYQDANRDPKGVDRAKGRLYRIRYHDTPRAALFDLAKESDEQLITRLASPNIFYRDLAQRLLWERKNPTSIKKLERLVLDDSPTRKTRLHALWALIGCGPLDTVFHAKLLEHGDATFRAWGVRAAGNQYELTPELRNRIVKMAADTSPDVQLQVAIAARKIVGVNALDLLVDVAAQPTSDALIPQIVWQNLHPLLDRQSDVFVAELKDQSLLGRPSLAAIAPRAFEKMLALRQTEPLVALLQLLIDRSPQAASQCLATLARQVQTRELAGPHAEALTERLKHMLHSPGAMGSSDASLATSATMLAATWKSPAGIDAASKILVDGKQQDARRLQACDALIASGDAQSLQLLVGMLADRKTSRDLRRQVIESLGRSESADIAPQVLGTYSKLEPELQPQTIELLTQRSSWSKALLATISRGVIPVGALNVNQIRRLQSSKDAELVRQAAATCGTVRSERNPARDGVVAEMRVFLRKTPGDARSGQAVFQKLCGQCHKIHGQGQDVGPDITVNGRSSFEQLISNVFDPSLVIGAAYQPRTVLTADGRVLTGLLVEDSPQRVVLKLQGGKLETIARDDVEQIETSKLSLMPEGVEKQLKPQELADLFSFLALDKPPSDPAARRIFSTEERVPASR
jgi:putative heme-binding domain-containing protein